MELREHVIRDRDGRPLRRSRNLRGLRTHARQVAAKVIDVSALGRGAGKLCVLFVDGSSYETNFASFALLRTWVGRWRSVYGTELRVNGQAAGVVARANPHLQP